MKIFQIIQFSSNIFLQMFFSHKLSNSIQSTNWLKCISLFIKIWFFFSKSTLCFQVEEYLSKMIQSHFGEFNHAFFEKEEAQQLSLKMFVPKISNSLENILINQKKNILLPKKKVGI